MKTLSKILTLALALGTVTNAFAQQPDLDVFRDPGKKGINVFETPKSPFSEFNGLRVRVGGDFALQFQSFSQKNDSNSVVELGSNFNLPTANLNIDVQMAKGVRLHMRTFLSARHHTEAWVKGGFLQIDDLSFITEGFMEDIMQYTTIRAGMSEYNYGDTHFRRSDNAKAIYNPFVGNYIMDSYTTEPFMEFTFQKSGIIGVFGFSNGRLNQNPKPGDDGFVLFGKAGYDTQINEDLRVRLTGSIYNSTEGGTRDYLYGGDRAGSRYYYVLHTNKTASKAAEAGDFEGRLNPGFKYQTAFMINPFVKFKGLEFFGVFENASNGDAAIGGGFTQLGAELLYRFGREENLYVGGRFNSVTGSSTDAGAEFGMQRINIGGGWFMTDNILTKIEYVTHTYNDYPAGRYAGAEFNGIMIEAVISF